MNFATEFFISSISAAGFSLFFFSIPGYLITRLLDITTHFRYLTLLYAPALGIATMGTLLLMVTWLFGLNVILVLSSWLVFNCLICWAIRQHKYTLPAHPPTLSGSWLAALLLIGAAIIWAIIPTLNSYPFIQHDALFVSRHIFDHMKIAIIDSIVRENMPPLNPFYAPEGQRIELIYYYGWHFCAALNKLILTVSGWQAEIGFSWFSSFALICFPAALAIRYTKQYYAGFLLIILASTGSLADLLVNLTGHSWKTWLGYPRVHGLELPLVQLSWAPQHAFSALMSLVLIFLIAHCLSNKTLASHHAWVIGLTATAGFNASVWVGGIALAATAPLFIFAIWLSKADYSKMLIPLALALLICILSSIPVLSSIISGDSNHDGKLMELITYKSTDSFDQQSWLHHAAHIILFWVQFLPLNLGIIYVLGLFSVLCYRPQQQEIRSFYYLSFVAIFGYLFLVQFVQSSIMNNDFGWRTVMVPILLLLVWATIALTEMSKNSSLWSKIANKLCQYHLFWPLNILGISLGLLATYKVSQLPIPDPEYVNSQPAYIKLHQDFFRLHHAWKVLRQHTQPDDIVQSNPATYAMVVTRWSAPASIALFGDRPTAYGDPESVRVFAHSYSLEQKNRQHQAILTLFSADAKAEDFRYAKQVLNIKAILVDTHDPVWNSTVIESSGYYELIEQQPYFKIYRARNHAPN